jgi:hypothetical protein
MKTGVSPAVRWLAFSGALCIFNACSRAPSAPPMRDVEVSISFSWKDGKSERPPDIEVGALPFDKARIPIAGAIARRDSTVNRAWTEKQKRQKEIEKLNQSMTAMGIASLEPSPGSSENKVKTAVEASRDALNNLADTAVLYLEDVKKKVGAETDKERLERFQKNLGAEELRDLALAIKAEDSPAVHKAIGEARAILAREVWAGKPQDREHASGVLSALEKALAGAPPLSMPKGGDPKAVEDLKERIVAVVKDQMSWDNEVAVANRPIRMYTALPDAEIAARTGGDGKCHLFLPREGRWVIFACVERPFQPGLSEKVQSLLNAEKEEMCWILEAPGAGTERVSLTLSETNAIRPGVAPLKLDAKGR